MTARTDTVDFSIGLRSPDRQRRPALRTFIGANADDLCETASAPVGLPQHGSMQLGDREDRPVHRDRTGARTDERLSAGMFHGSKRYLTMSKETALGANDKNLTVRRRVEACEKKVW